MSKSKDINDPKSVAEFIQRLDPGFAELIEAIRNSILETDTLIGEQIKWNAPCFFYNGDMKPFNPKEYKRDIVVVTIRKNEALLVFPTGIIINDTSGLLEGNYPDGRKLAKFKTLEEFETKRNALKSVVKDWLEKVEK